MNRFIHGLGESLGARGRLMSHSRAYGCLRKRAEMPTIPLMHVRKTGRITGVANPNSERV
jgi:hypothetical protein